MMNIKPEQHHKEMLINISLHIIYFCVAIVRNMCYNVITMLLQCDNGGHIWHRQILTLE